MNIKILTFCAGIVAVCFASGQDDPTLVEGAQNDYFSSKWKAVYSKDMLKVQPKWKLSENQPEDAAYEVRDYEDAYWVSSSNVKKCWSLDEASSRGYINIFFYLSMGFNHQGFTYDLTYPIVNHVENIEQPGMLKPKRGGGKRRRRRRRCLTKNSAMSYLPVKKDNEVATPAEKTLKIELIPERTVYVKDYFGNYTSQYCNQQASSLAQSLFKDGVAFDPNDYYCAKYAPGVAETENRYEIWFFGAKAAIDEDEM